MTRVFGYQNSETSQSDSSMVHTRVEQAFAFGDRCVSPAVPSVMAAAAAAAESCGEREPRKRRERRDSGCGHERKERRPHSEERAPPPAPPLHDYNRLESERRAERLSRARRPQLGGKRRRQPVRGALHVITAKENECLLKREIEASPTRPDCSPNARHPEAPTSCLDLGLLHHQLDRSEPLRSEAAERAQPAAAAVDADAAAAARLRDATAQPNKRLDKINKKLATLKRNISRYESEYESRHGYAMPAAERATDVQLTRMVEAVRRLTHERRTIQADPAQYAIQMHAAKLQKARDEKLEAALRSDKTMAEVVHDIEEWLEGTRVSEGRTGPECGWSGGQLAAEKCCVQRALLRLEAARGRPRAASAERGAARHIYDRYRTIKRHLNALRSDAVYVEGELATIHEDEAMLFSSTDSDSKPKHSDNEQESSEPVSSPHTRSSEEQAGAGAGAGAGGDAATAALHCLTITQLTAALADAHTLKLVLRRSLKEHEVWVESEQCRKLQPEDRLGKEDEYRRYKAVKARIKLLNALINKQKLNN